MDPITISIETPRDANAESSLVIYVIRCEINVLLTEYVFFPLSHTIIRCFIINLPENVHCL
jgi:hypothetical protein